MKLFSTLLVCLGLATASFAGGGTTAAPQSETNTTDTEVQAVYRSITDGNFMVAYYVSGTDMEAIRERLLADKIKFENSMGELGKFTLVCYNNRDLMPNIGEDPSLAYHEKYNSTRVCVLDNTMGFMRFAYGVRTDKGRVGDWQTIQVWDPGTKAWKQ